MICNCLNQPHSRPRNGPCVGPKPPLFYQDRKLKFGTHIGVKLYAYMWVEAYMGRDAAHVGAEGSPFQNLFVYQDRSLKFCKHIWSKMTCIYVGQLPYVPRSGPTPLCNTKRPLRGADGFPISQLFLFIKIEG